MLRARFLVFFGLSLFASSAFSDAIVENIRFGVLQPERDGYYSFDFETNRIPLRLKKAGFRFGIAFDNPTCQRIEWYEVIRLPSPLKKVTGNLGRATDTTLTTTTQVSNQAHVVDDFWFDKGDPVGPHQIELYVNGTRVFQTQFEVIPPIVVK